ncbi:PRC-barrel domain protein [Adlercreutzia sp. ZJ304]|uniref:PRC-barrel domain-containing protein n=1 Tax=Adlercreutzia sp. ZJ304 TaxID=2709791 RepID=UPI0013EB7240|nr:PRC-barrel domain protein [Adlercreutzia sp. ZJ304]
MNKQLESGLQSVSALTGKHVWMGRLKQGDSDAIKKVGRVRACVFHPKQKRCVGLLVKRPDVALMFHRADMFVAYNGFDVVDGNIVVREGSQNIDKGACKRLGVNLDDCVLWLGLAVMCEDGTDFGIVGDVLFHPETGAIETLVVSKGATANTLLGQRNIPASAIRGFKRGMGTQLYVSDDDDSSALGCILVDDSVKEIDVSGGVAEKAGAATAVAADKAQRVVKKVKPKAQEAIDKAKPTVQKASKAAGAAVDKGAYVTGRQFGRATGMFGAFKDEFDKALHSDE